MVGLEDPENLPPRDPQQLGSLINGDVLCQHIAQNMHPVDLGTAHGNDHHRNEALCCKRHREEVTFVTGRAVTSLSRVYTRNSDKGHYGTGTQAGSTTAARRK